MNYEFSHPCDDPLTQKIDIIGGQNYFLVCIGNLNYLHSQRKPVIENIRGLLFLEQVVLHFLPDEEMLEVLLLPDTHSYQKIHGNKEMLMEFLSRNRAA